MHFREKKAKKDLGKRKSFSPKTACAMYAFTGFLFLFCCLTESDLARDGNIIWTGPYTLKILAVSLAGGLLSGAVSLFALKRSAENDGLLPKSSETSQRFVPVRSRFQHFYRNLTPLQLSAGSLLLTLLAWLPGYLAYYPGICAYDSYIQTLQAASGEYINHHPIAHTLLISGAMKLGAMMGDVTVGIGLYTLLQMLFLASVFAYGMTVLKRHGVGPAAVAVLQLFCMFYPFHWYMSLSVTKDIVFTGFFMLQLLSLSELLVRADRRRAAVFLLSTVGMILFRNNGQYAFLVLLAFLALTWLFGSRRKAWRNLFLLSLAGFTAGVLALNGIYYAVSGQQGDKREMLSMPIQQLARVMVYHGGVGVLPEDDAALCETDKALINDFLLDESYREYDPHISDPVKRHTNTSVARYRPKEFLSTYLGLLAKYPGDYVNAALELNAGYLSPWDVSHAYINVSEVRHGLGYVQTRWEEGTLNENGIYKASKWESLHTRMERWADENAYLNLPLLKYLFVPGIWLWLYLLLAGFLLFRGKPRLCLPLAIVLGYYITLFLGPTVQLRYLYPVMAVWPYLTLLFAKVTGSNGIENYSDCAGSAGQAAGHSQEIPRRSHNVLHL